jgi:structure-specific endonuclease subunit SLX1
LVREFDGLYGFQVVCPNNLIRWALNNPHLTTHLSSKSRQLAVSASYNSIQSLFSGPSSAPSSSAPAASRKKRGKRRRPPKSLASVAASLHLLLGAPSFARWPIRPRFFNRELYGSWEGWREAVRGAAEGEIEMRDVKAVTDFVDGGGQGGEEEKRGIYALPLDYEPLKEYVAKGQDIFEFERLGKCVVCREELASPPSTAASPQSSSSSATKPTGGGLHAICPNPACDGVGHLTCWGRHLLESNGEPDEIVPTQGRCPKCKGEVVWVDMMKEMTLRVRAKKEVEKLLKSKRKRAKKAKGTGEQQDGDEA